MTTTTPLPGDGGPVTSPAPAPAGPPGSDPAWSSWISTGAWEVYLLQQLNLPITHTTVTALDAWTLSEDSSGGMNGGYNPLAITGLYPGAVRCVAQCGGSSPVMTYGTMKDGLDATAKFLQGSNYVDLLNSFRNANYTAEQGFKNTSTAPGTKAGNMPLLGGIWEAINASKWCSGCQGGKYPVALADIMNGIPLNAAGLKAITGGNVGQVAVTGTPQTGYSASQQGAAVPTNNPVGNPFDWLGSLLSGNLSRIGLFAGGAGLFLIGIVGLVATTDEGKRAIETAALA